MFQKPTTDRMSSLMIRNCSLLLLAQDTALPLQTCDDSFDSTLEVRLLYKLVQLARSVQGRHPLPPNTLPDPNLVFESLLKARDVRASPFFTGKLHG